eukprot:scaffold223387_cov30-Tisochrysis_lutea.AAC.5
MAVRTAAAISAEQGCGRACEPVRARTRKSGTGYRGLRRVGIAGNAPLRPAPRCRPPHRPRGTERARGRRASARSRSIDRKSRPLLPVKICTPRWQNSDI